MGSVNAALILIVDDERVNTRLLQAYLEANGYQTMVANSGEDCLAQLDQGLPDLILLDVMMPGMDGFEVTKRIKSTESTKNIPIIMVTGLNDRESRIRALEYGAEEFLSKPIDRSELNIRVRNLLRLKEFQNFLAAHNQILQTQVAERTRQLREAYMDSIITLTRASEYRDEETGAHVKRISHYCEILSGMMGLDMEFQDCIRHASPMHDVGKIGIPDAVLLKPGGFTSQEWSIMRAHCVMGTKILDYGTSPYLHMGAEIALNHHERWDGGGYPAGKKGEEIPISARIMNIADQYDALRAKRPYKPGLTHEHAFEIITRGDGRTLPDHFDPMVLNTFQTCASDLCNVFEHYVNE